MIYYSEKPLKTWQQNLILLDLEDDLGHIYVTRNTYDQAVLLSDRFDHDPDLVAQRLGCERVQEDIESYMVAILPHPINILAPFYNLIDKSVRLNEDNLKQVIGVLSYMSMNLDFNMMLKVPYEVRANLVFTKSILLDYLGHFEDFNFKISEYERHIVPEEKEQVVVQKEAKVVITEQPVEETAGTQEEFNVDSFLEDCGWNDVVVPSISATSTDEPSAASNTSNNSSDYKAGDDFEKKMSDSEGYQNIIEKFSI